MKCKIKYNGVRPRTPPNPAHQNTNFANFIRASRTGIGDQRG